VQALKGRAPVRLQVLLAVAIAATVVGASGVALSVEPDTYSLSEPWLILLPDGRVAALFIVGGPNQYAVMFGYVNQRGWSTWPQTITPRFGVLLAPVTAFARPDSAGRIHVAWSLYDARNGVQDFRYIRLDSAGIPVVSTGSLGTAFVANYTNYFPATPFPILEENSVHIVWRVNGSYIATTVSLDGTRLSPPAPFDPGTNESLPTRTQDTVSTVSDGNGRTFSLFTNLVQVYSGRQVYVDTELRLRFFGGTGTRETVLYSTHDWWWTAKPMVMPSLVALGTGTVVLAVLGWNRIRARRR